MGNYPETSPRSSIDPEEPLWTLDDLALFTGMTKSTLYGMRHEGRGPRAVKVGKLLRFRRTDVEVWLDAHTEPATESES